MYYTLLQTTPKIRSLAKLLATNSCITGFPLNLLNFIDTVIIYYADANIINENQRQPDSFCVLRGSFRSATVSAMYHSLCYIYIKIIIYLRHHSIMEYFRRQQPIHMLRYIIYMLVILSTTGISLRMILFLTHINHRLVPYYAQKLSMIFVTFSHASVMTDSFF
ncbi:unnamed protein product [Rotaria sordida]|uniref:G-protein coupled receptors family 1 profile domain-containing protein n=1 Tax=Rotaria sordida TaxID=392033 RepID=A0A814UJG4_9BILA|nr:unnamed protein product [Rotaria sordida]